MVGAAVADLPDGAGVFGELHDLHEVLYEFARTGDEAGFTFLVRSSGIADELTWRTVRQRVGFVDE